MRGPERAGVGGSIPPLAITFSTTYKSVNPRFHSNSFQLARRDSPAKGKALRDRLRQHAGSIDEATNINLADFSFRSLVVDDIWIPLGENMMIEQFRPIWNIVIDGFGNKDPGRRRATQYRSPWDVLHPGRQFAEKLADGGVTAQTLTTRLEEYFAGQIVPLIPTDEAADIGTTDDDDE